LHLLSTTRLRPGFRFSPFSPHAVLKLASGILNTTMFITTVNTIQATGSNFVTGDQTNVYQHYSTDEDKTLASLLKPVLVEREGYMVEGCMEGTREDVFRSVNAWLMDFGAPNILCITGSPGAGKSAIASSLVSQLSVERRLAAHYFFKRGDANLGHPANLWRTVAFDCGRYNPYVRRSLIEFLSKSNIREGDIKLHFECLIREPLVNNCESFLLQPVVVLDALDECGINDSQSTMRNMLLKTLISWSRQVPSSFKLVVTSREERLPSLFYDGSVCNRIVLETGESVGEQINSDLRNFFEKSFDEIRPGLSVPSNWPGQSAVTQLTKRAAGLFIWAKTAMDFIEKEEEQRSPNTKLQLILRGSLGEARGTENIDTLYRQLLDVHFKDSGATLLELFRVVVGIIITAKIPLRQDDIQHFLDLWDDEDVRQIGVIFYRLSSVISKGDNGNLYLKHLSFSDFLSDAERCRDRRFFINRSERHVYLAKANLRLMKRGLKFNICSLETSYWRNDDVKDLTSRIQRSIPTYLSYSCRFWANHLGDSMEGEHEHSEMLKETEDFLHNRLLYWLEVLSLIKEVSRAPAALLTISRWISVSVLRFKRLNRCFNDIPGSRLTRTYQPLQQTQRDL
jgi:hypothetical protein